MMARGNKLANCCVVLRDRERREVQTFTLSLLVNGHAWSFVTHQETQKQRKGTSDYGTWITVKCLLKAPTLQWPGGWLLARWEAGSAGGWWHRGGAGLRPATSTSPPDLHHQSPHRGPLGNTPRRLNYIVIMIIIQHAVFTSDTTDPFSVCTFSICISKNDCECRFLKIPSTLDWRRELIFGG